MEKIGTLRTICQTTAKKDVSNVYMRYVSRFFSIYLTRIFLPLGVTADQVSFLMILTGVVASLVLTNSDWVIFLAGALLLQLWYVLDCVDGEIARYHFYKMTDQIAKDKIQLAMTGGYWDYLNHYIIHGLVPFCVGFGVYKRTGQVLWVSVGFAASLAQTLLLAVHDTKSRAFIEKIKKGCSGNQTVQAKIFGSEPVTEIRERWSLAKWAFVVVHYSCTFPTVMNAVTVVAVFDCLSEQRPLFRCIFLVYYAVASWVVFFGLAAKNLHKQGVDRQFDGLFVFRKVS